ncbi:hypothetical protein EDB19DRAFT_1833112 [Suillus lakei]|nr:hypothetical protein EDB19DRAFT_1833112 [Suillus lakei]
MSNTDFSYGSTRYSHDFLTSSLHAPETARSSTSKTRTPLSPMIPQALPDLFNDTHSFTATPSASSFSCGAYIHSVTPNFQQIHVLQEQLSLYQAKLSETQLELCKTTTERDTIKASFGELIAVLRLPESTDPLNFSLTSSALTGHNKNAESGSGTRGKVPWLELEDGGPVTVEQLRAICKAIHAAWAELVIQKMAPPTWSRICTTGKKLVFDIVVKQFPLFQLDNDCWKLELLCINDYSPWRKNNLGTDRNWKDAPGKLLAKEELVEDDSDLVISESKCTVRNKNGKRQLSDDSESLAHQDGRKNFKSAPPLLLRVTKVRVSYWIKILSLAAPTAIPLHP